MNSYIKNLEEKTIHKKNATLNDKMRAKSPFIDNKKKALEKAKKINDHFKARVKDRELMITHLLQTEEVNDI